MLLIVIRTLFFLAMAAVGYMVGHAAAGGDPLAAGWELGCMLGFMAGAVVVIVLDVLFRRKNISVISAVFLGLVVGLVVATLLGPVVEMSDWFGNDQVKETVKIAIAGVASYLAISLILQTKDDFRFLIPYVEFAPQEKGGRPLLLDTSVIIDGRIVDIVETRFVHNPLVVPRFVLRELQTIADSSDRLKRNRGRRGLDVLNRLQTMPECDITIDEAATHDTPGEDVDQMLVNMAGQTRARIVTNDYNLNKVARLRGVEVLNINDLANALKPAFLPGETVEVNVLRAGQDEGQGVGYLEDGTMVVVEDGKAQIGKAVAIVVTSVLQTSAGRMVFGRHDLATDGDGGGRGSR